MTDNSAAGITLTHTLTHVISLTHNHRQGEGYFSINHETTDNGSMGEKEDGKMKVSRKRKSALHQEGKHQCKKRGIFFTR